MRIALDSTRGGAPLYLQVANALHDVIVTEQLQPGDLLPSENVLATENRLSRATVIKAFDTLVERGLVTRKQGKGTFVNARPMERQLPEHTSFSDHVRGLGRNPSSTLLAFETFAPGAPGRPASSFDEDVTLVMTERLRLVDGSPVGVHRTVVPGDVAQAIALTEASAAEPGFSLYAALHVAGIHLDSGEETLRAINADERESDLLETDEGAALIEVVRESRDTSGRLVEHVRARYLGSTYLYRIAFAPTSLGGQHDRTSAPTSARTGGGLAAAPDRL